jgi:hypothetical protein
VQRLRKQALTETPVTMSDCRFALLRRGPGSARILANDKEFASVCEFGKELGVFFPLSGSLAVLMAPRAAKLGDDYKKGPYAQRTVNVKGVEIMNSATWGHVGGCQPRS